MMAPFCRCFVNKPLDSLNLTSHNITMKPETRRSALGLIVLSMLGEEPMHPYRMQKLIRQRGKDLVVNVRQRASIYQTIDRLLRLGLIRIHETVSTESRPDHVVYAITDEGRAAAQTWLCEMLSTVGSDFPEFPAAVSVLMILPPDNVRSQLDIRAAVIRTQLARLAAAQQMVGDLPRLFMLEAEYQQTTLTAELAWLEAVIGDLRSGALTWNYRWLQEMVAQYTPDE